MNNKPLIKCACMFCDCDIATVDGVCYECNRGLHALNEWKDGFKMRMKPNAPKVTSTEKWKTETILQMNIANDEMTVRLEVVLDLLAEILQFAIIDVFEGKKCKLCGKVMELGQLTALQHEKDCPLRKIPKLKGD